MDHPTPKAELIADLVRWCVKHRDGWCAVWGGREPQEGETNVPTGCGFYVTFPFGYDRREPDCPDCLALLAPLHNDGLDGGNE